MKIIRDEIVYAGKYLDVLRRHFEDRTGKDAIWEMVKRKTFGSGVAIAAITPDKEIILEKIFRVPLGDFILELPAGLMDKEGESPEAMVRRELLEETGYEVKNLELLMSGPVYAGLLKDEPSLFLGTDARKIKEPALEDAEELEIVKVPVTELFEYLTKKSKTKFDTKIISVIPFLMAMGYIDKI